MIVNILDDLYYYIVKTPQNFYPDIFMAEKEFNDFEEAKIFAEEYGGYLYKKYITGYEEYIDNRS